MANTHVFTGADGALALSVPQSPEGGVAQNVLGAYEMVAVGRVQNVKVEVHSDIKAFHEIGQRYATELRPGNVTVRGTIGRAYVNGAMLKLLLGDAGDKRPMASWAQPAFNITLMAENAAVPGTRSVITIHDAKIDTWSYLMPEDDFVLESVGFQALFITVADEA